MAAAVKRLEEEKQRRDLASASAQSARAPRTRAPGPRNAALPNV